MGTFKPITKSNVEEHKMDAEVFNFRESEVEKVNNTIKNKNRIITVGTTSTRVVEHCFDKNNVKPLNGKTDLFIYPGYHFKVVNALITNFHVPKSTPFLLVSAFAGKELIKRAYEYAILKNYYFYSYGDSMLII